MTRINQKIFKEAVKDSGGNQSTIAQKIGVTRGAITRYLKKNPNMKELCNAEAERIIDISENIVDTKIVKDRDIKVAKWKLLNSKRGKDRGYGARQEIITDYSDEDATPEEVEMYLEFFGKGDITKNEKESNKEESNPK